MYPKGVVAAIVSNMWDEIDVSVQEIKGSCLRYFQGIITTFSTSVGPVDYYQTVPSIVGGSIDI